MKQDTLYEPSQPARARQLYASLIHDRRPVNAFLSAHHYLGGVPGWKFCMGAFYRFELVGVAVIGRPVSRHEDNGETLEIIRLAFAPGAPKNAPSWLIGRVKQLAWLQGKRRLIAYASTGEGHRGTIYKAAGFELVGETRGEKWSRDGRPRADQDTSPKLKFEIHPGLKTRSTGIQ